MKKSILILLSIMITMVSCGQKKQKQKKQQPGHDIEFQISGMENDTMLIAYHYSGKHYIADTVYFNDKAIGHLKGKQHKVNGVYLAVFPNLGNKYFEFLISDQHFTIKTDVNDLGKSMIFENSFENDIFTSDMKKMNLLRGKSEAFKKDLKNAKGAEKKELELKIKELNDTYLTERDKLMEDNPDLFYTDLLGLMKEVIVPDPPKKENGELVDSSFGWKYLKTHFWDYTDFSEEGILRTPIYHNKLLQYISKRTAPVQDSVIKSCRFVLEKSRANDEVFKYTLVTLLNKYANSKIMGDDAVYVDMIDEYYAKGLAPWTDSAQLVKMIERANALRPLLIGTISPDLTLRDPSLKVLYRLHDLPSDYTILFVWDPDCGHCKKAVPVLNEFYKKYKNKNIKVYAISTNNKEEIDLWKNYIVDNDIQEWINVADPYHQTRFRQVYDIASTPQLFVLDKNKKIIAKRIGAGQLEEFFFNYFKRFDTEKFIGMENLKFEAPDSTDHK